MKLSTKFFCIAYIIVLLSTGIGGTLMIKNTNDTLWNTQTEQVNTAINYAAESFLAFADVSYGEISESQQMNMIRQIKSTVSDVVTDITILTPQTGKDEYRGLEDHEGMSRFTEENDRLIMESVCCLNTATDVYFLILRSDFTQVQKQCDLFWKNYAIAVFSISVISGFLLLIITKKITRPLFLLTRASNDIASGNYGEMVNVQSSDDEIKSLSQSFNAMSRAIEQKINVIKNEAEKRDMFVADFTHELKTPMTAIIGYSQMLSAYELSAPERREASHAIYREAKRLEKLSLQLLDLYVYQNEKIDVEKIDLYSIGEQLKSTMKYESEKYQVSLCVNFTSETVMGNRVLLLSLLYNLIDNAFKASEPQTSVTVYSRSTDHTVQIFVADKGRGISKENIKLITEPFFREDKSRSRKLGGAGLGLSLCKEIASLHGTALTIESEKGMGTTVSFTLLKGGEKNA